MRGVRQFLAGAGGPRNRSEAFAGEAGALARVTSYLATARRRGRRGGGAEPGDDARSGLPLPASGACRHGLAGRSAPVWSGEYGEGFVRMALVENRQRIRQAARGVRQFLAAAEASGEAGRRIAAAGR